MPNGHLTPRQQRFVDEYLVDLNGTQAAIRAGYAAGSADVTAARQLAKPAVQAAIQTEQAVRAARVGVRADHVIRELALLAYSDIGQILDFSGETPRLRPASEIPESARRTISSVKVRRYLEGRGEEAREVEVTEFKLWDKLSALEKLGKHLGMFVERHRIEGNLTVQIVEELADVDPPEDGPPPPGPAGVSAE
jgi:phage terminase small subunit